MEIDWREPACPAAWKLLVRCGYLPPGYSTYGYPVGNARPTR